jgi:hypothetical protein
MRFVLWAGLDAWRAEAAVVALVPDGLRATGTQLGTYPIPYRLDYRLEATEDLVTQSLQVDATGDDWSRRLHLTRDGSGAWHSEASQAGDVRMPPAGGAVEELRGALDCDLGLSPFTNFMPVRRHGLHHRPGQIDFLMAWVSVPDLGFVPSHQRYEHVRKDKNHAVVRFIDLGAHSGFTAELVVDDDGLVLIYPELARRLGAPSGTGESPTPVQ